MARPNKKHLIYGVQGEGMGHAVRSGVIIQHLLKKYDVTACASRRAFDYLLNLGIPTKKIGGFPLHYSKNRVLHTKSLISNLLHAPKEITHSAFLLKLIDQKKPIAIISDFEPFTAYAGIIRGVPIISIDNQHFQRYTDLFKTKIRLDRSIASLIIATAIPRATHYFITGLVPAQTNRENVSVISPIIRDIFFTIKPKEKNFYFVYQTSPVQNPLIEQLKTLPFQFFVYGFHQDKKMGNITLRSFNEEVFLKDLSECKGVITGGGFGLLSEALFLGKPVYCIPVERQYEQILNAQILATKGYGVYEKKFTPTSFERFTRNLGTFQKNLRFFKVKPPSTIVNSINDVLETLDHME